MSELALSIKNPWALGIILGRKDVENRGWRPTRATPFGIWIHASKTWDRDIAGLPSREACASRAGTICGFVTVKSVHHSNDCGDQCSEWACPDQYHWMLTNATAFTPVACRGQLGLWPLPQGVRIQLLDTLAGAS